MCPVASQSDDTFTPDAGPLNPLGLGGAQLGSEFATSAPMDLGHQFQQLGFKAIARHVSKAVTLYRQGDINFLVNAEPDSFAARYAQTYGMGICALGMRVENASRALKRAIGLGALAVRGQAYWGFRAKDSGHTRDRRFANLLHRPLARTCRLARRRGRHLHFRRRFQAHRCCDGAEEYFTHAGTGLRCVDHMTQTVGAGRMQE